MTGLNQLIEYRSEDGTRIKEYYLILIFIGIFVICFISFIFETLKYIKKLEVQAERTQKNINNLIDLTNKSIFNLNYNIEKVNEDNVNFQVLLDQQQKKLNNFIDTINKTIYNLNSKLEKENCLNRYLLDEQQKNTNYTIHQY